MLAYNIKIVKDGLGFVGTCPDFPKLSVTGNTVSDVEEKLNDLMYDQLVFRIAARQLIPFPRQVAKRQKVIAFSMLVAAKVCLSNCMVKKNVQKTELAKKMNFHLPQISRLLDLNHATKIQTLEEALAKLGKRLTVGMTSIRDFD